LDVDSDERAGVYLTNALTGWEPLEDPKTLLPFPELKEERDKANKVKQEAPILVILGNPPYNAFAGTSPTEEGGLIDCYKEGLREKWGILAGSMHDLYIRFFRIAEHRIVNSGKGVVSYISNYSWTEEPSFVVLRKHLLGSFDKFWVENMHGNRKISEYAPDGRTSESVFAIPGFSAGIQQGVVISLWVRSERHGEKSEALGQVRYRDDINAAKAVERREQLVASLKARVFERNYESAKPNRENRFSFRPVTVSENYYEWASLTDICLESAFPGMDEDRKFALISDDIEGLRERMVAFYDRSMPWEEFIGEHEGFSIVSKTFDGRKTRATLLRESEFVEENLRRYMFRPLDKKWCYYEPKGGLWHRASPRRAQHQFEGNMFLVSRPKAKTYPEGPAIFITDGLSARDMMIGHGNCFPIMLCEECESSEADTNVEAMYGVQESEPVVRANLSEAARAYLEELGIDEPDNVAEAAGLIWMHSLAIGYNPAYLEENADGIRQDWPRIPLPRTKKALLKSGQLGRRVAALLNTEDAVEGVTAGDIEPLLNELAMPSKVGGGAWNPGEGDLDVTVGWGHAGKGGVCMPGKGKYEMRMQKDVRLKKAFGKETLDVYLNEVAYWANVPKCVWEYYIGGYQVMKKWLSYREKRMLGRGLRIEEAEYVSEMVRRLAGLILLQGELDANYMGVKDDTWPWPYEE
jgi:hypothetical protein